jgi:hypothetical protein
VAIAVQLDFPGGTLEEYDQALESIGFLPGGPAARGELFHWVTATDGGIRVVDVWESREAFDSYFEKSVLPVLSEVGAPDPPVIHVFDVHNYFAGGRW